MSTLTFALPQSIHQQAKELADLDGITLDQFIATAVAEKIAVLMTVQHLEERGKLGNRAEFDAVLAKVPDVEPEEHDRL
ncbi:MAG: hypothetical protein KDE19_20330 [Caldilineaceae bacterium]|nr:hypothetical protein [Caldilineaceae bacterium]